MSTQYMFEARKYAKYENNPDALYRMCKNLLMRRIATKSNNQVLSALASILGMGDSLADSLDDLTSLCAGHEEMTDADFSMLEAKLKTWYQMDYKSFIAFEAEKLRKAMPECVTAEYTDEELVEKHYSTWT